MKVYQIYFDENQLHQIEKSYIPYFNKRCTVFFENEVIRDLIFSGAHHDTEYFGVVSYQLRKKIDSAHIEVGSNASFDPDQFKSILFKTKPDVLSYWTKPLHDPILVGDEFHPNFSKYWKHIMMKIGYDWRPQPLSFVIYCNFFVAKSTVYDAYVREMLAPAMEVMSEMPELMNDSLYSKSLPDHLKAEFKVNQWPYHPFLCERMFSYYAFIKNLKSSSFGSLTSICKGYIEPQIY